MFRSDGLFFCEDFMWMAKAGLEYYLDPAWRYIQSGDSAGDWEFASGLLTSLAFQTETYKPTPGVARLVRCVSDYIRLNAAKFCGVDVGVSEHILQRLDEIETSLACQGH